MSVEITDPVTGKLIGRFDSREAFDRYAAVSTAADRCVSGFGKYGSTHWYLKDGRVVGRWQVGRYMGPPIFREQPIADMGAELARLNAVERRQALAQAEAATRTQRPRRNASSGIDLGFRPASYWDHPASHHANIKGTLRRQAFAAAEGLESDELELEIFGDSISEPAKQSLQRLHPSFRSGEDLPNTPEGEIEIARLTYTRTIHCEVTSIRAWREDDRIRYRVVDEYSTPITCGTDCSDQPLTLGELIDLIEGSSDGECRDGLYFGDLDWRLTNEDDATPEALEDFFEVSSPFYPEIGKWYEEASREWVAQHLSERDTDTAGADDTP